MPHFLTQDLLPKESLKGYMASLITVLVIPMSLMVITSFSAFLKLEYGLFIFLLVSPLLIFIFIKLNCYVNSLLGVHSGLIATLCLGLSFVVLSSTVLILSIFSLNALLDNSPPEKTSVTIIDKDWQRSFGSRLFRKYYVYIKRPETINFPFYFGSQERVRILPSEYKSITLNRTQIHLFMHKGAFGIPYYSEYSFDGTHSIANPQPTLNPDILTACKWSKQFNLNNQIEPLEPDNHLQEFWPNGSPRSVEPTVNGLRHGIARYTFANGFFEADIPWKHGQKHGSFKIYRDDGTLKQSQSYKDGKLYGIQKQFKPDGTFSSATLFLSNGENINASVCGRAWE